MCLSESTIAPTRRAVGRMCIRSQRIHDGAGACWSHCGGDRETDAGGDESRVSLSTRELACSAASGASTRELMYRMDHASSQAAIRQ